jgi:hypothetical protein
MGSAPRGHAQSRRSMRRTMKKRKPNLPAANCRMDRLKTWFSHLSIQILVVQGRTDTVKLVVRIGQRKQLGQEATNFFHTKDSIVVLCFSRKRSEKLPAPHGFFERKGLVTLSTSLNISWISCRRAAVSFAHEARLFTGGVFPAEIRVLWRGAGMAHTSTEYRQ